MTQEPGGWGRAEGGARLRRRLRRCCAHMAAAARWAGGGQHGHRQPCSGLRSAYGGIVPADPNALSVFRPGAQPHPDTGWSALFAVLTAVGETGCHGRACAADGWQALWTDS